MQFSTIGKAIRLIARLAKKSAPVIMLAAAGAGVACTAIIAAEEIPEAKKIFAEEHANDQEGKISARTFKATARALKKTVLCLTTTLVLMFGSYYILYSRYKALLASYTRLAMRYDIFKQETARIYGPAAVGVISGAIASKTAPPEVICHEDFPEEVDGEKQHWFRDDFSQEWFRSDWNTVKTANLLTQEDYQTNMVVALNKYYEHLFKDRGTDEDLEHYNRLMEYDKFGEMVWDANYIFEGWEYYGGIPFEYYDIYDPNDKNRVIGYGIGFPIDPVPESDDYSSYFSEMIDSRYKNYRGICG